MPPDGVHQEKIQDFYEEVVPGLTDQQYKEQFRLSRDAVRRVLEAVEHGRGEQDDENDENPLEKKLLVCLWYMGSVVSFRKVAMVFGMSLGAAWAAVDEVVALLVAQREAVISLPSKLQFMEIMGRFAVRGFPGAIGAVDGCHIQISRPSENEHAYVNRKHVHAINLMAVVDDRGEFIDVSVGWPGSVHDSRVFKNGPLARNLESDEFRANALPDNCHILGDAAFQLSTYLVTPFRENQLRVNTPGEPTAREKRFFNYKLSSSRVAVEHAFGRLKGRFRRLHYVETKSVKKAIDIVVAACVLHNMCVQRDEWEEAAVEVEQEQPEAAEQGAGRVAVDGAAAVQKRLALVREVCGQMPQ